MMSAREAYKRGYDQIDWSKPIKHERKERVAPRRSSFPCPMVVSDAIEPCLSVADGKWHDSMSSLMHSYTPEGNPQGERYELVDAFDPSRPKTGNVPSKQEREKSRIESIHKAEAKIARGEGVKLPD